MLDFESYLNHRKTIVCQYLMGKADHLPLSLKIWSIMGATPIESQRPELQELVEKDLENIACELLDLIEYPCNTFSNGDQAFQMFKLLPFEIIGITWEKVLELCKNYIDNLNQ